MPQVTDYTVKRNTRSSLKAYAADRGVITIDSSSDEGDDTSLGASNCASNNTPNDAPEVRSHLLKVQQLLYLYQTDLGLICCSRRSLRKGGPR